MGKLINQQNNQNSNKQDDDNQNQQYRISNIEADQHQSPHSFILAKEKSQYDQRASNNNKMNKMISKQTKVKLGRPTNNDRFRMAMMRYTQVDLIKNSIIKYLDHIGFKQGLVFTQSQRKRLQHQQQKNSKTELTLPQIKWDDSHCWIYQQQVSKITQILKQQNIPQQHLYPKLYQNLLDISDIFAREATNEIYRLLLTLYMTAIKNQNKTRQQFSLLIKKIVHEQIQNNRDKYHFIVGQFSYKFKSKKKYKEVLVELEKLLECIVRYIRILVSK